MAALVVRSLIRSRLTVSRSFAANIDGREEGSADLGLLRVPKAGFHRDLNGGSDMVGKNIWANVNRCEREQQRTRTTPANANNNSERERELQQRTRTRTTTYNSEREREFRWSRRKRGVGEVGSMVGA